MCPADRCFFFFQWIKLKFGVREGGGGGGSFGLLVSNLTSRMQYQHIGLSKNFTKQFADKEQNNDVLLIESFQLKLKFHSFLQYDRKLVFNN